MQHTRAFLIHQRPYRESSVIAQLFTEEHGMVHAMLKGAKRSRAWQSIAPFTPLALSYRDKRELIVPTMLECQGLGYDLQGLRVYCAWYVHELIIKLLPKNDPHPRSFTAYEQCLQQLMQSDTLDIALRIFERTLLEDLGYAIPWHQLQHLDHDHFTFHPEHGFQGVEEPRATSWTRQTLNDIEHQRWQQPHVRQSTKQLLRGMLDARLGHRPLKTREILQCLN